MNSVSVVGYGGLGKEVASMLPHCGMTLGGFYDDDARKTARKGSVSELYNSSHALENICLTFGDSAIRKRIFDQIPFKQYTFPNIIHPLAYFQAKDNIRMGIGNIIAANNMLTCDITIGNFCLINLNCTIGHDAILGDFCSLMPAVNISGNVHIGEGAFIGTGAVILPNIRIGKWATVGAGAVVLKDIPDYAVVVGNPARTIKFNSTHNET